MSSIYVCGLDAMPGHVERLQPGELEAARRLRAAAPHARPNPRLVGLADELLADGRLLAALDAMGPAEPSMAAPLVCLPRRV